MSQNAAFPSISRATLVTAALAISVVIVKTAASIVAPLLLAVFIALLFWGWVLGTVGVFLATPLTIALVIALEASPQTRPFAILLGPTVNQLPEPE